MHTSIINTICSKDYAKVKTFYNTSLDLINVVYVLYNLYIY